MQINYTYSMVGTTCDRCGNFIKNIYTVEDGSIKLNVGSECIKKVSNVSEYASSIISSAFSRIKKIQLKADDFSSKDYDMLSTKYFNGTYGIVNAPAYQKVADDHKDYIGSRNRTLDEFKIYVDDLFETYTLQIKHQTNELNKKIKTVSIKQ